MIRQDRSFPAICICTAAGLLLWQEARADTVISPTVTATPVPVPQSSVPVVSGMPLTFAPLVKQVVPAVVNIAVTRDVDPRTRRRLHVLPDVRGTPLEKKFRERMRRHGEEMLGAGSGFIVDPQGYIVTNTHVVGDASNISVSFTNGRELPAQLIGSDDLTDIALIKVESPSPLPSIRWGDSRKIQVGDWILAAGNPFGLGSSVTAGIVSARGRDIGVGPFDDFLQLDAPINPGNSGGPTFNMNGEVVALNTAIVSPTGGSVGIGFSIPAEIVQPVVEVLRRDGHIDRGWLGVTLEDVPGQDGGRVVGVDKGGPAQKAGLKTGDLVISFAGEHIISARSLIRAVAATRAGAEKTIGVRRRSGLVEMHVTVGLRPVDDDAGDDDGQ
ncbi:trypsin-like peptidase domain-containing protein [Acetobacter sp. AN02]|uniref:S1C family serine protease n=1 Tax=Acetobacter sp. AN02 TaxID=2894186 RepID=UPI0024341B31|nr:trypsin-like peptidase domain-containing protein [Acetobacter sp. AN02]MDG6094834.1 trypsin-like peptidase domain-containing protein [Acetobacter sp. AN02]